MFMIIYSVSNIGEVNSNFFCFTFFRIVSFCFNSETNLKKSYLNKRQILVNNKPAKIRTKSTEMFKNINTKQINYSLEFDFAFDVINNVL